MRLSQLGFGASSLGGVFHSIREQEGIEAVSAALEGGINFIDVSPYYGHLKAETVLGKALKEVNLRGQVIIAGVKRSGDDAFVPGGNYVFTEGDTVLVCCLHSNSTFVQELFR